MPIIKDVKFATGKAPETYMAAKIQVSKDHFIDDENIVSFLKKIDEWTYAKDRDKNQLLMTIKDFLATSSLITNVLICKDYENGLTALIFTTNKEKRPKWNRWLSMVNYKNDFNFGLYELSSSNFNDVVSGKTILLEGRTIDQELTRRYNILGIF